MSLRPKLLNCLSRAEKFDKLNPSNQLSKVSLQQKLIGNHSKVDFALKPSERKRDLIPMNSSKRPAPNKKSNYINKIIKEFQDELCKSNQLNFRDKHRRHNTTFLSN